MIVISYVSNIHERLRRNPADPRQLSLRVFIRFSFERIFAFVGGPREARDSGLRPDPAFGRI